MSDDERCPDCEARVHRCETPSIGWPLVLDARPERDGMYQIVCENGHRIARYVSTIKLNAMAPEQRPRLFLPHNCPNPR